MRILEVLSYVRIFGAVLFLICFVPCTALQLLRYEWYWQTFIPKLWKKQDEHPVISNLILLVMIYGCMGCFVEAIW